MVQQPAGAQVKNDPLADLLKQLSRQWYGIVEQGPWASFLGLSILCVRDKIIRIDIIER